MKKLAIFLIPFMVSIPAFTQDKSSFTKHFSLIKHSGACIAYPINSLVIGV